MPQALLRRLLQAIALAIICAVLPCLARAQDSPYATYTATQIVGAWRAQYKDVLAVVDAKDTTAGALNLTPLYDGPLQDYELIRQRRILVILSPDEIGAIVSHGEKLLEAESVNWDLLKDIMGCLSLTRPTPSITDLAKRVVSLKLNGVVTDGQYHAVGLSMSPIGYSAQDPDILFLKKCVSSDFWGSSSSFEIPMLREGVRGTTYDTPDLCINQVQIMALVALSLGPKAKTIPLMEAFEGDPELPTEVRENARLRRETILGMSPIDHSGTAYIEPPVHPLSWYLQLDDIPKPSAR